MEALNVLCEPYTLAEHKQIREELGMTVEEFEKYLNLPRGTIREWEAQELFNAQYGIAFYH